MHSPYKRPRLAAFLSGIRFPLSGFCIAILLLIPLIVFAEAPQWWRDRGVLIQNGPHNDYGPANAGQLKNIATKARDELNASLPLGSGTAVNAVVNGFTHTNNYAPINLGQLKAVAKPFYDQLILVGFTNNYPWMNTTGAVNLQPANIGQVKNVFSFDLQAVTASNDSDGNGLPDWWEMYYFGYIGVNPNGDANGDGVSDLSEFLNEAAPVNGILTITLFEPAGAQPLP